jgi:hypothetical protein
MLPARTEDKVVRSARRLGRGFEGVELGRSGAALDRTFVQRMAGEVEADGLRRAPGQHDRALNSLVRLSSRAAVFTVSPMAVTICERGGPIALTIASLK